MRSSSFVAALPEAEGLEHKKTVRKYIHISVKDPYYGKKCRRIHTMCLDLYLFCIELSSMNALSYER